MKETVSIVAIRYRNEMGEPTCAVDFSKNDRCEFYRTQRYGTVDTCAFATYPDDQLVRSEQSGYLQPGKCCPLWRS